MKLISKCAQRLPPPFGTRQCEALASLSEVRADQVVGAIEIIAGRPDCETYENVICWPGYWALYDETGARIEQSTYRRESSSGFIGSVPRISYNRSELEIIDDDVVFGGSLHTHFGHFLCTGLARIWALEELPGHKVLFQGAPFAEMSTNGLGALCFSKLGVDETRVIEVSRPTLFRRMVIPGAAFDEQWRSYTVHRDVCRKIGSDFTGRRGGPIYMSKARLKTDGKGVVQRTLNEQEIEEVLVARGVEIVYPERLPIGEQIALFASGRTVMGLVGSALHVHVFAPAKGLIIGVSLLDRMASNQLLLDGIAGRKARYFRPTITTDMVVDEVSPVGFDFLLNDPKGIARDLLRMI